MAKDPEDGSKKTVSVRLPPDINQTLDEQAFVHQRSRSSIIEDALRDWFKLNYRKLESRLHTD